MGHGVPRPYSMSMAMLPMPKTQLLEASSQGSREAAEELESLRGEGSAKSIPPRLKPAFILLAVCGG